MPPEHVRLDEVHEDEPLVDVLEQLDRPVDAVDVRLRREGVVDVAAGEDVGDLPDAVDRVPGLANRRQVVRTARLEREVVAVRCPFVVAGLTDEGAGDDTSDRMAPCQDPTRGAAALVQLLEGNRLFVRCDLEHGVRGRVDDPLPGLLVLLAELLDDLGSGSGRVAEHTAPGLVHERIDDVVREPVRDRSGTALASRLPCAPSVPSSCPSPWNARAGARRPLERRVAAGSPRAAARSRARAPRGWAGRDLRPRWPRCRGCSSLRPRTPLRLATHQRRRRRARLRTPAARRYSTAALEDVLGLVLLAVYIVGIVGLAAAITLAVIKIFPTERNPKKPDEPDAPKTPRGEESAAGRLFRRAKREGA